MDLPFGETLFKTAARPEETAVPTAHKQAGALSEKTLQESSAPDARDAAMSHPPEAGPPGAELSLELESPGNEDALPEEALPDSISTALDDWKAVLRQDFEEWLDSLDDIPELTDADFEVADTPDLYSFHAQLTASNAETRKANRRTAEAFSQWGDTLSKFDGDLRGLREQMARLPAPLEDELPRKWCLALAEILDRALRLAGAFAAPPPKSWWGRDASWQKAWATQKQGLEILVSHLEELLQKAGMTRLSTVHQPFDPTRMAAIAIEHKALLPHHTVIEEVAPGYTLRGDLLRVAQVKVSTNKPSSTPPPSTNPPLQSNE